MKKGPSFMSLVYRDFCVTKKLFSGTCIGCVMVYIMCIMYTLSVKYGNLSKLLTEIESEGIPDIMWPVRLIGIYFSFMIFMFSAECSAADLKNKTWALYRKSLPVKPAKLAFARVTYQIIAFAVSIGISFVYLVIDCLISGNGISGRDIVIITVVSALIVLLGVLMTVCVEFMRSIDKGGLMAMGILFAILTPVIMLARLQADPDQEMDFDIFDSIAPYSPLFVVLTVVLFAVEGVLLMLMYKREEK